MLRPGNAGVRAVALASVALFFDEAKRDFFLNRKKKIVDYQIFWWFGCHE